MSNKASFRFGAHLNESTVGDSRGRRSQDRVAQQLRYILVCSLTSGATARRQAGLLSAAPSKGVDSATCGTDRCARR